MSEKARKRPSYALLRLRSLQSEAEPVTEVNIIPVIDISLVLLVILFVTAPILSVPNIPVDLPKAAVPESSDPTVAVTLLRDGTLSVRSAVVSWEGFEAALAREVKRFPGSAVVLRVDQAVPYRFVARLLSLSKKAGASRIAFGTAPNK
ncbi:MAG TPA: biopolymer transporter ExbD [Elusimicrobia bacterium]|nr:biopolymer transporter ExbD [Elusimicrobiota bacterium]HBT62810.1 biopolymer transporter ExbD [Elusimicrobiota bacterium]